MTGATGVIGSVGPILHDERKEVRVVLELPVMMLPAATTPSPNRAPGGIRFDSANVSTGGAFLRTDLLLEVGDLLTLQFELPGGGRSIRTAGRVTHVSRGQAKEVPGMGVEFVDLQPDDRAAIEERLRQ